MPTTSSCDYLSLSMLLNLSNDADIVFTITFHLLVDDINCFLSALVAHSNILDYYNKNQ